MYSKYNLKPDKKMQISDISMLKILLLTCRLKNSLSALHIAKHIGG